MCPLCPEDHPHAIVLEREGRTIRVGDGGQFDWHELDAQRAWTKHRSAYYGQQITQLMSLDMLDAVLMVKGILGGTVVNPRNDRDVRRPRAVKVQAKPRVRAQRQRTFGGM